MASKTKKRRRNDLSATVQWLALAAVLLLIIVAIFAFGWGGSTNPTHSG